MNRKEMGLAVKALVQYASDCSGNSEYLEMNRAFQIALGMAYMYELKEEKWIASTYNVYLSEAKNELADTISEGQKAQDILVKLENDMYWTI